MKKMFLIINPVSGKRALQDCLMKIIEMFSAADYDTTVYLSKSEEDMINRVKAQGSDYDIIVCCT